MKKEFFSVFKIHWNGRLEFPESAFLHLNVILDSETTKCGSGFPATGRGANDLPSELNVGGCEWGRERVRWGVLCNLKSSGRWVTDCLVPFCYPTNASSSQSISTLIFYSTFKIYQKFDIMVSGHCIRISSFPTCRKLTCMKYIDILAAACLFSYSNQ